MRGLTRTSGLLGGTVGLKIIVNESESGNKKYDVVEQQACKLFANEICESEKTNILTEKVIQLKGHQDYSVEQEACKLLSSSNCESERAKILKEKVEQQACKLLLMKVKFR